MRVSLPVPEGLRPDPTIASTGGGQAVDERWLVDQVVALRRG
jgi:hypothetical protein